MVLLCAYSSVPLRIFSSWGRWTSRVGGGNVCTCVCNQRENSRSHTTSCPTRLKRSEHRTHLCVIFVAGQYTSDHRKEGTRCRYDKETFLSFCPVGPFEHLGHLPNGDAGSALTYPGTLVFIPTRSWAVWKGNSFSFYLCIWPAIGQDGKCKCIDVK